MSSDQTKLPVNERALLVVRCLVITRVVLIQGLFVLTSVFMRDDSSSSRTVYLDVCIHIA